jgi:urease accessory protein
MRYPAGLFHSGYAAAAGSSSMDQRRAENTLTERRQFRQYVKCHRDRRASSRTFSARSGYHQGNETVKKQTRLALAALIFAAMPSVAHAHTGAGSAGGFAHGFMHPVGGLDHILAMVAVGTFASVLGGRALWLVPASFVLTMAFGGLLGIAGIPVPFVEAGITASIIVLGLAVAFRWNASTAAAMTVVGLFAIFHGHAHGTEMPLDASALSYGLGFMAATTLLHITGIGLGLGLGCMGGASAPSLRMSGGAMALAGLAILTGYL